MPPTPRMTADEKRIARDMHKRGFIPKHLADHLGRERSTITRLLAHVGPDPRQGRPEALSDVQVARAIRVMEKMIADALQNRTNPTNPYQSFTNPDTKTRLIPLILTFVLI